MSKGGGTWRCREKKLERARRWREANREKKREKDRERARRWREANREESRERSRRWREANREKKREQNARRVFAGGIYLGSFSFTKEEIEAMKEGANGATD